MEERNRVGRTSLLTRTLEDEDEDEARAVQHEFYRKRKAGSDYAASRAVPARRALALSPPPRPLPSPVNYLSSA